MVEKEGSVNKLLNHELYQEFFSIFQIEQIAAQDFKKCKY